MERHQVEFSKNAAKDYKRLPTHYKVLIDAALTKLSEGGNLDIKPIKGENDTFRIRIGRYRILYLQTDHIFLITRIAHRQNIYK